MGLDELEAERLAAEWQKLAVGLVELADKADPERAVPAVDASTRPSR